MGRDHHSETQVVEASSRYSLHVEIREKLREKEQRKGPLTTDEIAAAQNRWLKIAQEDEEVNCPFALKKTMLDCGDAMVASRAIILC